jgi:hypothetical protein
MGQPWQREVKDIVMAPQPNLVTAVLTRVGR